MKKINSFLISTILIFLFNASSNSQWYLLNTGTTADLNSIFFINPSTGFACGTQGIIIKTSNAGLNWTAGQVIDTSFTYTSVYFRNSNTGYIAGRKLVFSPIFFAAPVILKTTNSGLTWNSLLNDSGYTLWQTYFINDNTGIAGGGLFGSGPNKLLITANGGLNWAISAIGNSGYIVSLAFINSNTGYSALSPGEVYRTTNSGFNWEYNSYSSISFLTFISFINSSTGFTAGSNYIPNTDTITGSICRTQNGGANWSKVYEDSLGTLSSMFFTNINKGYAAGEKPYPNYTSYKARILRTTNGGSSWFRDSVFQNILGLTSVYFIDSTSGYVTGTNGTILKTTTGGNPAGIKPINGKIPKEFSLSQNYPNPFNPSTKIKFSLPLPSKGGAMNVSLKVYDILGREIANLIPPLRGGQEGLKPGEYVVEWNAGEKGSNYTSGIYFYTLTAGNFTQTKKMVLVK